MADNQQENSTSKLGAEQKNLFGPPPLLSSENGDHYNELWTRLATCLNPRDFMEELLVKTVVDATWLTQRYVRHQTLAIERRFRQNLEFQAKRSKDIKQRRDEQVKALAEKTGRLRATSRA
jgi:hypothetical protein